MFTAKERAGYLGASDMPFIMNEHRSPEQLMHWWECKVGLRDPDPPTYAMRLGSLVGEFILDEYGAAIGEPVTRRQEIVPSPVNRRLRSTLDGYSVPRDAVIEAKFASPFFDKEQIFSTYYPQVALQMHCTDAKAGFLVVAQGTNEPFEIECIRDAQYEQVLLDRAAAMLECMDTLTPPVTLAEAPPIVPPEKWRTVDLTTLSPDAELPNWTAELLCEILTFANTKEAADECEAAAKAAKALIPDDVGKVLLTHHIIARNKKGSLAITRRKT
jgi:predicted phage-related endonuclease